MPTKAARFSPLARAAFTAVFIICLAGCSGQQTQHDGVGTVTLRTSSGFCVSVPTLSDVCFKVTDDTEFVRLGDCVKVSYTSDDVAGTGGDLKSLDAAEKSQCSIAGSDETSDASGPDENAR